MFQVGSSKAGTLCLGQDPGRSAKSMKKFATLSTRPGRF